MKKIKYIILAICLSTVTVYAKSSEDSLIVRALYFEVNNPQESAKIWKELYEETEKEKYLIEYFNTSLKYKKLNEVVDELKEFLKKQKSQELYNLLTSLYLKEGDSKSAIDILSKDTNILDIDSLYQLAYLYSLNNRDDDSLKIYQKIYEKEHSWESLKGVLSILSKQDKKGEVIDRLWSAINSNSKLPNKAYIILSGLLDFKKDTNRAIYLYDKLYQRTGDKDYIKQMITLYLYKKDTKDLVKLLEKTSYDDKLLYELYVTNGDLENAYKMLDGLYSNSKDAKFIAEKAMLVYEIANKYNNLDNNTMETVGKLFEQAFLKGVDDDIYYNYYGYILIENNTDIAKGLIYVQKALDKDRNNIYYLDSLAWGNYKINKCSEAENIVVKIENLGQVKETDIAEHIKTIKSCENKEQ